MNQDIKTQPVPLDQFLFCFVQSRLGNFVPGRVRDEKDFQLAASSQYPASMAWHFLHRMGQARVLFLVLDPKVLFHLHVA